MNDTDGSGVKSAERVLTILELFSQPGKALTFTQVAEVLGYPRSSLHGLLRTMTDRGWLDLDSGSRRFTLGLRAWETGVAYGRARELCRTLRPVVDELQAAVDGTVHVSVLDDGDSVAVVHTGAPAWRRMGAHKSTSGKVLLAHLERSQVERQVGGDLDGDIDQLHRDLEDVRDRGFAEGDSRIVEGRTLAVPVRDRNGEVIAALGVTAPPDKLEGPAREHALAALRQAADRASQELAVAS